MILDKRASLFDAPPPVPVKDGQVDKPPPYAFDVSGAEASSFPDRHPRRPNAQPSSTYDPNSFNQICLQTRHKDISGSFVVEPSPLQSQFTNVTRKTQKRTLADATFRTRRGAISVDLTTAGDVNRVPKATVVASSRRGDITINVLPISLTVPRINLEVYTRHGDIVVMLPRTYSGAIQLRTRKGTFEFLPHFASIMNVAKANETEALVLFGSPLTPNAGLPSQAADFSQLVARTGKIIVGLSGKDHYERPVRLWERLGAFFRGDVLGASDTKE